MQLDTMYNNLKQKGLKLSQQVILQWPKTKCKQRSIMNYLMSMVQKDQKIEKVEENNNLIIPLSFNTLLICRGHTIQLYKYEINKQNNKPIFNQLVTQTLNNPIQKIYTGSNQMLLNPKKIPILLQFQYNIDFYLINITDKKIQLKNSFKYKNIQAIKIISDREIILLTKELQLHQFLIQNDRLKLNQSIKAELYLQKDEKIKKVVILQESDMIGNRPNLILFYSVQNANSQMFKVKQYGRTQLGNYVSINVNYTIVNTLHSTPLQNYKIYKINQYFCLETKFQILILKKKFNRYLFIDSFMQNIPGNSLKLNSQGLVVSYNNQCMQISVIKLSDPKCQYRLLDSIDLSNCNLCDNFLIYSFQNQKQTSLMIIFYNDKQISLYNVIKLQPMTKMLEVVQKINPNQISIAQQIALNLGVERKQFYLNVWLNSKKQLPDIDKFLLPCQDVTSIKKQLHLILRKKTFPVCELIKILQKITKIIQFQLQQNLSQKMLRQYIKNDFLLRKMKLKQVNKLIDHKQMDKLYNSSLIDMFVEIVKNNLYPQEKKLDPLHIMVDQPIKQETNLMYVFQVFRIMILENYKNFLITFLQQFELEQIANVLENYSYLLPLYPYQPQMIIHEPDYMTQTQLTLSMLKITGQSIWFADITSIEFAHQLSREKIEKQLYQYHPTSKISEALDNLIHLQSINKEQLYKHGLISCSMKEYKLKLANISGIKLFLKVCEYINKLSLQEKKQNKTEEIINIFHRLNKLTGQAYQMVQLYSYMHYLLDYHNFFNKKYLTIQELKQYSLENIVALFFLQNKQRKDLILNQFRQLYLKVYGIPTQFNKVIQAFIYSENCSKIQLQILLKQIQTKQCEFQSNNQQLIELIIDGFCTKLQIRQDTDTKHFLQLMQQIELCKNLGIKINKIIQIRKCIGILNIFNCQKLTYYQMLTLHQDNKIFKLLLNKYFNHNFKKQHIKIQDQEINLQFCRNMLTILLYLQQTIYDHITQRQLLLVYGEILIQWKQFEVISTLLYEQDVLQKLNIDHEDYVNQLILRQLNSIYQDQDIIYDQQTKQQIKNIISIDKSNNLIKLQQQKKLQLVTIFQNLNCIVHPNDIFIICYQWKQQQNRTQFIEDLIKQYLSKLTFKIFQQIYKIMQIIDKQTNHIDIFNTEFVSYCLYFADRLLEEKRYSEILEILTFVGTMENVPINYALITQTILQIICIQYHDNKNQGIQAIEYYTQFYNNDVIVHKLLASNFCNAKFKFTMERAENIQVDVSMTFKKKVVEIPIDILFKLVQDNCNSSIRSLYYNYYFLIMIFRSPINGLSKLYRISYQLEQITNLLFEFENVIEKNEELWGINFLTIIKKFRKGLYLQALPRIKQLGQLELKTDETQLNMIKNILKQDKQQNLQLLKCLSKVQSYISQHKSTRKSDKEIRFEKYCENQIIDEIKITPIIQQMQFQPQIQDTINLRNLIHMKVQISNVSANIISQNDLLEQIYQNISNQKQNDRIKIKSDKQKIFVPIIQGYGNDNLTSILQEIILNKQFDKLCSYSKNQILTAMRDLYDCSEQNFYKMITILDEISIGNPNRIKICRLSKIYQTKISSQDLKKIFSFDFLTETNQYSVEQNNQQIFQNIYEKCQNLMNYKPFEYIRQMADLLGYILEDKQYMCRIYTNHLQWIGKYGIFSKQYVIKIRKIMDALQYNLDLIIHQVKEILLSFKNNEQLFDIIREQLMMYFKDNEDIMQII